MTILANDGWILATRGKKTRRRIFIATTKCKANLTQCSGTSANKSSFENLGQRVERARFRIPYRHSIIASIERILQNKKLALVRVFGIGPFDMSLDSIYQLGLLEHMKDHFSMPLITSQDPLTTNLEKQYLKSRGIRVLPPDDLRSNPIVKTSKDEFTLLYMIHCTQDMYENVLSYYAGISALHRLILIGNDPHGIANHSVSSTHHLKNFAKICTSIQFPEFEPCPNAFHETAMCFVEEDE